MALIIQNDAIYEQVATIFTYYKINIDPDIPDIKIYATNDIKTDASILYGYKEDGNPNGVYIYPNEFNNLEEPVCLIKEDLFYKEGVPYFTTVLHELVHVSDFEKFRKQFCRDKWNKIKSHRHFKFFKVWTEFHAKLVSLYHTPILLSILYPQSRTIDEEKLKDKYTNQHLPIIKSDLENALDNNFQLVDLFYFLGGFMACEQFNTDLKITDHIPPKLNEFSPDVKYLYKDLKNSLNFEDVARNFHYFSSMMEEFL